MKTHRPGLGLWFIAALTAGATALMPAVARAQAEDVSGVGPAPIVRVVLASGNVTVRTWDRPSVQIDDPSDVNVRRFTVQSNEAQNTIPILAGQIGSPSGPVELPEETFPVSTLSSGSHDVVAVKGQDANVTVTVPQNASLVTVQMGKGNVTLQDYRSGTFVARVRNGTAHFVNVGGDGYVQVMRGQINAENSTFNRLRARSATGDVVFANCNSKQIEVSSVRGSIVYDGGTFEPGLARFESQSGDVALGVNGGAQLDGHAGGGHIYTSFDSGAQLSGHDGEQQASVSGGGPLVNATSGSGNVYLYGGQLASHHVPADWQPVRDTLVHAGRSVPAEAVAAPSAHAPARIQRPVTQQPQPQQQQRKPVPITRPRNAEAAPPPPRRQRPPPNPDRPHPHRRGQGSG